MGNKGFVNQKLNYVEEIVLYTDAHVFLTGKAGTGKTTFLRSLPLKTTKRMAVVAPTGVAAINAGGQTIHSFFQLPFGPQIPEDAQVLPAINGVVPKAKKQVWRFSRQKLKLMRSIDLLIIDEVSMVRADVLDAVDSVLRYTRRSSKPFGGVQLLMIGDVHQLAPVAKPDEWEILLPYYDSTYFFSSHVLRQTPYLCVELDHIYRQHDAGFVNLLNKVRDNKMDASSTQMLNARYQPDFQPDDKDGYITLTTHNYQADSINETNLNALRKKKFTFTAEIEGIFPESIYPTKPSLELKVGAQVMFIKNDPNPEKAYFNGKIGILSDYNLKEGTVEVKCGKTKITVHRVKWQNCEYRLNEKTLQLEEVEIGGFTQIPLRLAWAVTIHKSQGLTFDKLIVDAGQAFAHGQVYVALSRCTSLDGLVLKTPLTSHALVNDYKVSEFVQQIPLKEPSREKVEELRHAYELENMLELFDFQPIYNDMTAILELVKTNKMLFQDKMIQRFAERVGRVRDELWQVGAKFAIQLRILHRQASAETDKALLQERITKGVVYFSEHLDSILHDSPIEVFATDIDEVDMQLAGLYDGMKMDVTVKTACLTASASGFEMKNYLEMKLKTMLQLAPDRKVDETDEKPDRWMYDQKQKHTKEKKPKKEKGGTYLVTRKLIDKGMTLEKVAKARDLAINTIYDHVAKLVSQGVYTADRFVEKSKCTVIKGYCESNGNTTLKSAKEVLGDGFEYWEIRVVMAEWARDKS